MQKSGINYPKRGDIFISHLGPAFGREIHKKRPVLIISNDIYNRGTHYAIVIPTSSIVPHVIGPEMVFLGKLRGLDKKSILLPLFVRGIDQERLAKKIGTLPKEKLLEVEEALQLVLGLTPLDK
ncbi:type II toxin-antitoxin system PemK/MazF family toxin [Candidatus Curtissbacteria bacterium]|nr:type II toxin-antitoxin system PemK/MazF family toxin [Candidatus Curtissbacteria bacterium]